MSSYRSPWRRWFGLAVWATLVAIAFAATAAARENVRLLDRPLVMAFAHDPSITPPLRLEPTGEKDTIAPQIAVTNVGPALHTLPSVTIADRSQTLSLRVEVATTVGASSTTSVPTVAGTTETNTSVPTPSSNPGNGGELSFTGVGRLFIWELALAAIMLIIGLQILLLRRRHLRRRPTG